MSSRIFVSYSQKDRERLAPVVGALRGLGHEVWWDIEIAPGEDFRVAIQNNIARSDIVLVVWSEESTKSFWVVEEAYEALRQKKIFPVLIDDVSVPFGFQSILTSRLDTSQPDALAQTIDQWLARRSPRKPDAEETPAPAPAPAHGVAPAAPPAAAPNPPVALESSTFHEHGWFGLFPGFAPTNEPEFLRFFIRNVAPLKFFAASVGVIVVLAFVFWDITRSDDVWADGSIFIRIFVVCPLIILVFAIRDYVHPLISEFIQGVFFIAGTGAIIFLLSRLDGGLNNGMTALLLCLFYGAVFLRVRTAWHIRATTIISAVYLYMSYLDYYATEPAAYYTNAGNIVVGSFFTIAAAFLIERSERYNFARQKQLSISSVTKRNLGAAGA